MHVNATSVKCKADYILELDFSNGEIRQLDMTPYLEFGVFSKLKDQSVFRSVLISFDTIAWSTGADLDPDFVYRNSIPVNNVA